MQISIETPEQQTEDDENDEETWEFKCSFCSKTHETRRQCEDKIVTDIPIKSSKNPPVKQILGKGVKKSEAVTTEFPEFANGVNFVSTKFAVSSSGMVAAVDKCRKEVVIFDQEGKVESHFQFLNTHEFQGGLAFSRDDFLLIGLKGEKYSCVAFYKSNGKFEYSAFLEDGFSAQLIVTADNEGGDQEYLVYDGPKRKILFINGQKLLSRTIELESSDANLAISNGCVYSLVAQNGLILRKPDQDGNSLNIEVDPKFPDIHTNDVTIAIGKNENIIVVDRGSKNIHHLSKDGKFICSLLKFEPQEGVLFSIIDIHLDGQDLKVLTHLSDTVNEDVYELRSFTFSTPKKFLKKKEIENQTEKSGRNSKCCVIL